MPVVIDRGSAENHLNRRNFYTNDYDRMRSNRISARSLDKIFVFYVISMLLIIMTRARDL